MASLSYLPTELVEYIVTYLSQHEISSFCRLNRHLNTLATPFLYRHVDLFIPPGNKLPRIDRFCLNIINDSRKANNVDSVRLGLSPSDDTIDGQQWLPQDEIFDDQSMFNKAMDVLSNETLVAASDYLRDAIGMREYSAYAALILLILPSLQRLDIADPRSSTFGHLQTILRNLDPGSLWNRRFASKALVDRLSSIKHLSVVFDHKSGVAYRKKNNNFTLDYFLNIPRVQKLEHSISGYREHQFIGMIQRNVLVHRVRPTDITILVFRHSAAFTEGVLSVLQCTPKLRSFTYDFFFDCKDDMTREGRLVDLASWSETLRPLQATLEMLVFSIEYCDTTDYFFNQPRIRDRLYGYLDLTFFSQLYILEVPFPFLTGDVEFSIGTEVYPLFPPNLRHLTLRPDLSHAQHPFPFDLSRLSAGLTFEQSKLEAQYLMNARMDVSYMYQTSLTLLDLATTLESISVWQPADPSLEWFSGQVEDFATTCRNKNVTGRILMPMLLRWKKAAHWDLVRENTVFDRKAPDLGVVRRLWREEWEGRAVGLASQYHLHALMSHQVKLHR